MGYCKTQTGSLDSAVAVHLKTLKLVKQLFLILRLDADAGIPDNDGQDQGIFILFLAAELQDDRTLLGIFNCIIQKIR